MADKIELLKIYPESFQANIYNMRPFRMIGLIDASIKYDNDVERVTLAYYRSSGTNNGKIKGLWYPIVGIKTQDGRFIEFTQYINSVLTKTTSMGIANKGWLAKSLFFSHLPCSGSKIRGFSNGIHYEFLFETGKKLRDAYENNHYQYIQSLDAKYLNRVVTSKEIYPNNHHSQRELYECFIKDIFKEFQ